MIKNLRTPYGITLKRIKDIFVIGCIVALRFCDLASLKRSELEIIDKRYYITKISQKTKTRTRVLLPEYAVKIIRKYKTNGRYLLPVPSKNIFNKWLKRLGEMAKWTYKIPKIRMSRGVPKEILTRRGTSYRFCDHISSHIMRRTSITTMLQLGMNENLVRKISGHAPGSKEFYRYVELSQTFMDEEIEKIHLQISLKTPN